MVLNKQTADELVIHLITQTQGQRDQINDADSGK